MEINKIGEVRSKYKKPVGPEEMKKSKSVIEIEAEYTDDLDAIDCTPVVDIKPYASFMDQPVLSLQKKSPYYF